MAIHEGVPGHEGLLIGGSCGSTVAGAYRFIKENKIPKAQLMQFVTLICFVYYNIYIHMYIFIFAYEYIHIYI
jgi:cysteine synthase